MKRLYRAVAEVEVFFVCEEGDEDLSAEDALHEECSNNGFSNLGGIQITKVTNPKNLGNWTLRDYVYGEGQGDLMLGDAIAQYVEGEGEE